MSDARRLLAAVGLGLAVGWAIGDVGAVAERLAHAYGVRLGLIGLFTTALFLVQTAIQIPAGRVIDRLGARAVGLGALVAVALGGAVCLGRASFPLALAGRALTGLGTGSGFLAGADFARGRPLRQGVYGASSVGGVGLAIAVVPQLAGWRAPYWSSLVVCAVATLAVAAAPRPELTRHAVRMTVLRDRRLYPLGVLHACSFGFSIVVGAWITALLHRHGFGHRSAALVGGLVLLLSGAARPLGGLSGERAFPLAWASLVAGAAGCALLASGGPPAILVLGAIVAGLAAGLPFAPAIGGGQRLRPDAPAAAVGLVNGLANLTILVVTPLIGLTFSLPGAGRVGFAVLACLWAAGLLAVGPAHNPRPPRSL